VLAQQRPTIVTPRGAVASAARVAFDAPVRRWLPGLVIGAIGFGLLAGTRSWVWSGLAMAVAFVLLQAFRRARVRRAVLAAQEAGGRGDVSGLRRASTIVGRGDPVRARFFEAIALTLEERFAEAATAFGKLATELDPPNAVACKANIAWCRAHLGEGTQAVAIAREALAEAERLELGPQIVSQQAILGTALARAGDGEQGITLLRRALETGTGTPAQRAGWAFELGEALRAADRPDEAASAYSDAARWAPASPYGARALERLQDGSRP
jgi:tetratricopeptide (TPR) repeat protein